jgi:hypothetical protein
MTQELLLNIILIILNIFSFSIGLILGKIWSNSSVYQSVDKPKSFLQKTNEVSKDKVSIDDKKVVLNIKTDGMEKKYENLGEVKQSSENISSSVDKLKQMKKG